MEKLKIKRTYWIWIAGIAAGAALGYAYYYFVGCANGTCAITSRPLNSTLYGAFMGGLLASLITTERKKQS